MINKYFLEVFENAKRQGPGSESETHKVYQTLGNLPENPAILDIGCGKGAQSFALADISDGHICATDMHKAFLGELQSQIQEKNLGHRITTMIADMAELPFLPEQFDVLWAEGSAFIIGYEAALEKWKKFIKPGGYLAFSDCVWLTDEQPEELVEFWKSEEIDIPHKSSILEKAKSENYTIVDHFTLSKSSWKEEFYDHIEVALKKARAKFKGNSDAEKTFNSIQKEIDMFDKYNAYYGYEFFILKK